MPVKRGLLLRDTHSNVYKFNIQALHFSASGTKLYIYLTVVQDTVCMPVFITEVLYLAAGV